LSDDECVTQKPDLAMLEKKTILRQEKNRCDDADHAKSNPDAGDDDVVSI